MKNATFLNTHDVDYRITDREIRQLRRIGLENIDPATQAIAEAYLIRNGRTTVDTACKTYTEADVYIDPNTIEYADFVRDMWEYTLPECEMNDWKWHEWQAQMDMKRWELHEKGFVEKREPTDFDREIMGQSRYAAEQIIQRHMASLAIATPTSAAQHITGRQPRQRGASSRSSAQSGDSNDGDSDPDRSAKYFASIDLDPDDILVPDPAPNSSTKLTPDLLHKESAFRFVRKAVSAYRLRATEDVDTTLIDRVSRPYIQYVIREVLIYMAINPAFTSMSPVDRDEAAPLIADHFLMKWAESHNFDKTPNPNIHRLLNLSFRKTADVYSHIRGRSCEGGTDLCLQDHADSGGYDIPAPGLKSIDEDAAWLLESRENLKEWKKVSEEAAEKAEEAKRSALEALRASLKVDDHVLLDINETHYEVLPAVPSSKYRLHDRLHNQMRHDALQKESTKLIADTTVGGAGKKGKKSETPDQKYIPVMRICQFGMDDDPDDHRGYDHVELAAYKSGASVDLTPITEDERRSLEAIDAARAILQYVQQHPDEATHVASKLVGQGEVGLRVIRCIDLNHTTSIKVARKAILDCISDQVLEAANSADKAATEDGALQIDMDQALLIFSSYGDQIIKNGSIFWVLSHMEEEYMFNSTKELISQLKTRAANKAWVRTGKKRFSDSVSRGSQMLLDIYGEAKTCRASQTAWGAI